MTINLNANPYFDDFSEDKSFHQILFRPGYSVQARELTQLQSILRDQIAKFGGHVFKHGSVVIPGNSSYDLNVCYVKLDNAPTVAGLVGSFVSNATTGLRGLIKAGINADGTDPSTIYISYTNTGLSGGVTTHTFTPGDSIAVEGTSTTLTVAGALTAVGGAAMATIAKGVFFVNGTFVTVPNQTAVIGKYTGTPSCHVLLKIVESTVDSDMDSTLLDPAQGSYNYAAPGADRLKIDLILTTLPLGTALTDDYVEIMRFNEGNLEEHLRYSKYNELEKNLARRTYDEAGDYVVSGLNVKIREHLHTDLNGGRYSATAATPGNIDKMIYTVTAGKAYIRGFETEVFADREIIVDKARDSTHVKKTSANLVPSFGQYLYIGDAVSLPDFTNRETVTLYNCTVAGSSIGTAKVLALDFHESNTTDANVLLKLFISDLALTGGNDVSDIGRVTWTGGSAKVLHRYSIQTTNTIDFAVDDVITDGASSPRTATTFKFNRSAAEIYVYKETAANSIPAIGDNISHVGGGTGRMVTVESLGKNTNNNLLLQFPRRAVKAVTTDGNSVAVDGSNIDITYKTYHSGTVDTSTGTGTLSVPAGMTIDTLEQGNLILTSAAGVHPISWASLTSPTSILITVPVPSRPITAMKVICATTKVAPLPKKKSLIRATETGLTPGATVQLANADGVRLISVSSTVDGNVTKSFVFVNGQDDFAYYRSSLKLISSVTPGGTLTVVYDYFSHIATGGDYFSVDSYVDSTMADYFTNPVLNYTSKNTGRQFDLRNCLDFRPRVGTDGTFSGTGASTNELAQNDSRVTTSLQSYIGRFDIVVLSKDGTVSAIRGVSSETPRIPAVPAEVLYLAKIHVTPYTYSAESLKAIKQNNRGYTMKDVGTLETRVKGLEDYVTLTQTENSVINYDVVDAKTGLSRYKSGYLVETFSNPDSVSDVFNPLFRVSYVSESIVPMFEVIDSKLTMTANEAQVTGTVVTLPYTHSVLAKQPISSKYTNINPFSVFSWTGSLAINPSTDTWVEVENLNAIVNNTQEILETTTVVETTEIVDKTEYITIRRPWVDLAPAPLPVVPTVIVNPAPVIVPVAVTTVVTTVTGGDPVEVVTVEPITPIVTNPTVVTDTVVDVGETVVTTVITAVEAPVIATPPPEPVVIPVIPVSIQETLVIVDTPPPTVVTETDFLGGGTHERSELGDVGISGVIGGEQDIYGGGTHEAGEAGVSSATSTDYTGSGKIICTAMNDMYGLPYRENKIWLKYSATHMKPEHQVGYHKVFLPLVDYAFKQGNGVTHLWLRSALIWIGVNRTKDIQDELAGLNPRPFKRMFIRKPAEAAMYYIGKWFSQK